MRTSPELLAGALSNQFLHLVLMPTEACNFRCTYCYEDFRLARMQPEVVEGLKRLLTKRAPTLRHLHLAWFGGEPLLALDTIVDVLKHVARLREEHPGLELESDMTTNAWGLKRAVFEGLCALGVRTYQISFDGPQPIHDQRRRRADGAGTFERVWSNVLLLRAVPGEFEIRVRVHVDRGNVHAIPEFLSLCQREFEGDERFKLFVRPLSRLGGPNDALLDVLDESELEAIGVLRSEARSKGLAVLEPEITTSACHASWANSFVVRADGRLSKCTVALSHPANDVGRLHADGRMEIDASRARPWMRGLVSGERRLLLCPLEGFAPSEATRQQ